MIHYCSSDHVYTQSIMGSKKGFTLLETLLVIVVGSILVLAAGQYLSTFFRTSLESNASISFTNFELALQEIQKEVQFCDYLYINGSSSSTLYVGARNSIDTDRSWTVFDYDSATDTLSYAAYSGGWGTSRAIAKQLTSVTFSFPDTSFKNFVKIIVTYNDTGGDTVTKTFYVSGMNIVANSDVTTETAANVTPPSYP